MLSRVDVSFCLFGVLFGCHVNFTIFFFSFSKMSKECAEAANVKRTRKKIYVCRAQVMITTKGDFVRCGEWFCVCTMVTLEEKELNDFLIKCFNALCQSL